LIKRKVNNSMNKEKLIKLVSIVSGTILIGVIILFLIDKDWSNALFFSMVFLALWIFPAYLNKK
tara:strand:- start:1514 stop:1705 length:192 start_codon:yes stop_codon:yes gene_type:complete